MGNYLLNEESAYCNVKSKVEMESIVSTLLHPRCKLRDLRLDPNRMNVRLGLLNIEEVAKMIATAIESEKCSLHSLTIITLEYGFDVGRLAKALQSPNCHLKGLGLRGNKIGSDGAKSLVEALQSPNCHLESLDLESNEIGSEGAKSLAKALQSPNCHLKSLDLQYNQIELDGIKSLAEALQSPNCHLKSLGLIGNQIGLDCAKSLAEALQSPNCHLESLDLKYNKIESDGIKSLAEALQSPNCRLESLGLERNKIGSEGAKSLAEALQSPNCHLKSLDLQYNQIESDGIKSLVKALESENCHLMSLDFGGNTVGMSGIEALAEFFESKSCRFEFLYLGTNDYEKTRTWFEIEGSQIPRRLWHNKLWFSMPNEGWCRTLENALASKDCHVQALDIRGQSLGDDDLSVLFQALTTGSWRLKSLVLGPIGDLTKIAKALQSPHCQLEHLVVMYSAASSKGEHLILLADALQSDHCKLQTFMFVAYRWADDIYVDDFIAGIADALKQQHCKLQNLELKFKHTEDHEKQLLDALKFNYMCPLQQLRMDGTLPQMEEQFSDILNRNRILRQSGLANQAQVQPTTAKLFICGFSGVGKTTLRKNLLRNMALPKILQQHPSTTGMDLQTLQFGEKKLVLCDLAGQKEFHAFHHHFVRGSDKDIFLIVCKAPSHKDNSGLVQFNNELGYWLRFIVSHSWLTSKPKVLIVLNYFSSVPPEDMTTDARTLTRNQIDKYNGLLDFGKSNIEDNVFGVVALYPKDLRLLKANIKVTLGDLLKQRQKIPLLCSELIVHLRKIAERNLLAEWNLLSVIKYGRERTKIISFDELIRSLLDDKIYITLDTLRPALSHLHDMGELIYFIEIPDIVILDAQWFVREVIGSFITPELLGKPLEKRGHFDITHVKRSLLQICGLPSHIESILECLNKMGVIFLPNDVQVLVPALLEGTLYEYGGFRNMSKDIQLRGRRYECKDKEHTLLPSGIFTKLQVRLQDICCNKSYHVGGGWVAFAIEDIHFCIKVGGHTDDWKDRQWIDIMIWFPTNAKEETISSKYLEIQRCMFDVCISDSSCPRISLEEYIMRFEFTKNSFYNGQPIVVLDVEPLSRIKHDVQVNGLSYMHTWNDSTSSKIVDLLFLEELSEYNSQLRVVEKKLRSIESEVDSLTRCEGPKRNIHLARSATDLCKAGPYSNDQLIHKILEGQEKISDKLDKVLEGQENLLEAINGLEGSIKKRSEEILRQVAKSIQLLKTDLPSLPYFTDEQNFIQKYSKLFRTNIKFHLLCEAREGPHQVENQEGISMTLPSDWLVKTAPILAPAITCITIAVKVAMTIMAGGPTVPQLVPSLVNILAENIPSIVSSILEQKVSSDYIHKANKLTENEMREFLRYVTKGNRLDMKAFGLYKVMFPDSTFAWLCKKHAQHCEILEISELDL